MKNRNILVFTDNWYTSIELALGLLVFGMVYLCGTIKANRKGIPKEGLFPKTGRDMKARGYMQSYRATHEGKKMRLVAWQDNKPVHMLSTLPSIFRCEVFRNVKENRRWMAEEKIWPT
jgi:hypothetical protein